MTIAGADDREAARAALLRELEALGEPAPSEAELEALLGEDDGDDVAFVARLAEVAAVDPHADPQQDPRLDDMGQRRAWSRVEGTLAQRGQRTAGLEPGPAPQGTGRPSWVPVLLGVAALAAAVALAFLVVPPSEDGGAGGPVAAGDDGDVDGPSSVDAAELEALSAQARAGLDALGVDRQSASKRAREMRAEFRAALPSEGAG